MQESIALGVTGVFSGLTNNQNANKALETLATCFAGPTAPTTTYANQFWADTANDLLKQRNAANNAWISVLVLSTGAPVNALLKSGGTMTGQINMGGQAISNATIALASNALSGTMAGFDAACTDGNFAFRESGTWTPIVLGDAVAGVGTYVEQTGTYRKVGDMVIYHGVVEISAHTGSGSMLIGGLGFSGAVASGYVSECANLTILAGYVPGFRQMGGTQLYIDQIPVGGGASSSTMLDAAFRLNFTIIQFIN